jgi:hypothetical protein
MRITELVKTYRWINDPDVPPWNVRFVGALAIFGIVAVGVAGIYLATRTDGPGVEAYAATAPGGRAVRTEYVGFPPGPAVADSAPATAALEAWKAQHPDVTILSAEPVLAPSGAVAGYDVVYLA